ncbi:unnamed protein product [Triticum turgidum subsp. durum]|uniref:Protein DETOXIFICATION n=1 Tax=Triticum turgidum subsp. durum TaxID=4567 RepID=A0A9R0WGI8_TRITD|nr:unnamed protein product [Triticum turgidum subsp. durum]
MAGSRRGGDEEACRVGLLDGHGGAKKDDWQVVAGGEESSKLGRRVLEESKKLWVIVAPAMFSRIVTFSMNVITQAFAGHLGDLELAAISIANTVVVGFSFGLMVRNGERAGDAVRAGVRRQEVSHDGRLHAALLDRAARLRGAAPPHVLLRRGRAAAHGAVAGAVGHGRQGLRLVHPAPLLLRPPLPAAALPAVPDEELRQRRRLRGGALRPPPRQLALHHQVSVRARRHRADAQLLLVGHLRHALRLRRLRRLPGHVARLLRRGVRRHLGVRQALRRVRRHAMLGELVLQGTHLADREPEGRGYCGGCALHLNAWEMMIPLAFFAGTGVRVANELGAGNGKGARFATIVSSLTSLVIGLFFWVLIMGLHDKLALIFTSSAVVLDAVNNLAILLAFTILLNSIQPVLSGVAVGSGWQSAVAYVNIGSYYLIGVPMGVLLGWLFNLGVLGIWAGMIGGTAVQTMILAIMTVRCDWEKEAMVASTRMDKWSEVR